MHLGTDGGVSLPVVIAVDRLTHKPLGATIDALPAAVYGALGGSTVVETTFAGKAGEKITVNVEAQRLGSKLRPVVHLYGPKKLQCAWAWGQPGLAGDARLETTLPESGTYTITLHDAEYAGPAPGFFRIKVGTFDYIDQVFPPVASAETKSFEVFGSKTARTDLLPVAGNIVPLPWPKELALPTGPRPWVERSSRPEFIAPSANGKAMDLPAGPVAVSGKLTAANEEQRFRVTVTPNTKVRFEVFAERIGSPIDAAFVIRNETGGVLAQAEDSPGTLNPVLEYAVPDKVTAVTVGVLDSSGKASPRGFYRLVVDPVKSGGSGDFYAFTPLGRLTIPAGGRVIVPVYIDRRGYQGKIAFTADSFLGGIKFEDTVIAPDADGTLVTVSNNGGNGLGLGEGYVLAVMHWKLSGEHGETRSIFVKGHPLEHIQPWLAGEISLSQTKQKAEDFTIDWRNLPPDAGLSPGGKLSLPFTVKRLDPAARCDSSF